VGALGESAGGEGTWGCWREARALGRGRAGGEGTGVQAQGGMLAAFEVGACAHACCGGGAARARGLLQKMKCTGWRHARWRAW
jgi:hypothetical protein